jgi:hypothetical protein
MNSRLQKINFLDEGLFFPTSGRKTGKVSTLLQGSRAVGI